MSLRADISASRIPLRAFVAEGLFWGAFAAYVPSIKAAVGLSDADFGLALLFGALGAVSAMWVAPFADRRFGPWAMSVGAVLMAAAFLLPGLMSSWLCLSLALFLAMSTSGMLDVIMNARLSGIEVATGRSLMNLNHAIFSFVYAGSALMAGVLREFNVSAFTCFAALGLVTLWLAAGLRHETQHPPDAEGAAPTPQLPKVMVALAGLVTLIGFMAEQATEGWSALHLERAMNAGAAEGAMGPAILGLTMGIGRLSGQFILRVMSEGTVLRIAALLAASGAVLAAWAPTQVLVYAGFAILGAGVSVTAPTTFAWIGKTVAPQQRTVAISRVVVIGYTGFFMGPPLMGFLAQAFGLPVAFTVLGVLLSVIALVLVPILRHLAYRKQDGQKAAAV